MSKFASVITFIVIIMISAITGTVIVLHNSQNAYDRMPNVSDEKVAATYDTDFNDPNHMNLSSQYSKNTITRSNSFSASKANSTSTNSNTKSIVTENKKTPTPLATSGYTATDVSSHSARSDCWIIITDKVYNVTSFLTQHPGGVSIILMYCGKDATTAFNSNSVGHNHSAYARSLLPGYYVGDIKVTTDPNVNNPPSANAGGNQVIVLPTTSITLYGSGYDSDGSIASYAWTRVSGTGSSIGSPTSASTSITGLAQGSYTFKLVVTDNKGATGSDTATVTVNQALPNPPASGYTATQVAAHGTQGDCWIIISGKVYDVSSFLTQHPGGVAAIVAYCGADATTAFNSNTVGHNHSAYARSLLPTYYVGDLSTSTPPTGTNIPPTANAGTAQTITLPTSSVTLSGSGSDSDGTIASYAWSKVSGAGGAISTPSSASTTVTGLSQGSYTFRLTVTDNAGATGSATVTITVNPTPPPTGTTYTTAQVATHSTQGDCWIIISGKVYNVTSFLSQHPGGVAVIVALCGADATTAFNSNTVGHNHSAYARSLLPTYYVGDVGTGTPPPTGGGGGSGGGSGTVGGPGVLPSAVTDKYPGATIITQDIATNGSQEVEINTTLGACRHIKTNSSGAITSDQSC